MNSFLERPGVVLRRNGCPAPLFDLNNTGRVNRKAAFAFALVNGFFDLINSSVRDF